MNPVIRDRWVAALRSGTYQQGTGYLRSGDAYCCLGVLCELAVADGVIPPPVLDVDEWVYGVIPPPVLDVDEWVYGEGDLTSSATDLPFAVQEWANVGTPNPPTGVQAPPPLRGELDDNEPGTTLAEHNDGGVSFAVIANLIEAAL